MRDKFFKNEMSENISRNSMTSERLGKTDQLYFQLKGTSSEVDLADFVDEFDSLRDNRRIKLHWGDDDIKF